MYWKKYKALPEKEKRQDNYYIVGLDIGNDSSGIAFYNVADKAPEMIDLSGGYGKPTIPTAMQYIVDTKEWVYGEYALQNNSAGKEITLKDLVERLGNSEYVDIDNKPVSIINLLGMYIKELMSNVKNINPKAEIAGIVASVPSYFSVHAREELKRAFKNAGYEKELIDLVSDRECVFGYHMGNLDKDYGNDRILLIDYGAREVRGGIYEPVSTTTTSERTLKSLSALFEDTIGTRMIEAQVKKLFTSYYEKNNPLQNDRSIQEQLATFTYQHKDILFQKPIRNKPAKLYFNFAYPPFQQVVTAEDADKLIAPFHKKFDKFILQVFEKTAGKVTPADIDRVVCVGGGFEMLWVKDALTSLFPQGKLHMFKNAKAVTAMGAAVVAAQLLGMTNYPAIVVEDRHQLAVDIGLKMENDSFIPLAECNSFWWQPHHSRSFIINAPVDAGEKVPIRILSRTPDGDVSILSDAKLEGLPKRPKGTTRLGVQLTFTSDSEGVATVLDYGFGELFPKSEFKQEIVVRL